MVSKKLDQIKRFEQVFSTLVKYELGFIIKSTFSNHNKKNLGEPEVIRKVLEDLGGTFVKMGQFLSLRPDLIPQKYCDELSKLQDEVKPFSFDLVKQTVEKSLGRKIRDVFSSFNKKPVASASIGQVHRAVLKNGKSVAVKVRRPGIDSLMETDMELLGIIAKLVKKNLDPGIIDPEEIIQELKEYTEKEINFLNESSKIEKFSNSHSETDIKIPGIVKELCNEKVIVMEFIEGKKLSDFMKEDIAYQKRKEISDTIVNSFFRQVFMEGLFHADPHPGNILVLEPNYFSGKKIAFLDFGITGELNEEVRRSLVDLFVALLEKDIEKIINSMAELHFIDTESQSLRQDMRNMLGPYYGVSLKNIDVPKLFVQSIKVSRKNKIKVPKDYVLLGKALITLESVCGRINPEFNLVESSRPFVSEMMLHRYSPRNVASSGILKIRRIRGIIDKLPSLAERYLDKNMEHETEIKSLSDHMAALESDIKHAADRFVMVGIIIVLLIAGLIFYKYPPFYEGIPVVSALLFAFAFIMLIDLFVKSSK